MIRSTAALAPSAQRKLRDRYPVSSFYMCCVSRCYFVGRELRLVEGSIITTIDIDPGIIFSSDDLQAISAAVILERQGRVFLPPGNRREHLFICMIPTTGTGVTHRISLPVA